MITYIIIYSVVYYYNYYCYYHSVFKYLSRRYETTRTRNNKILNFARRTDDYYCFARLFLLHHVIFTCKIQSTRRGSIDNVFFT